MPKIQYQDINIRHEGLKKIMIVNDIIDDYTKQGYTLTLRQIYYQLVSNNVIENSEKSYNNLGNLINNGKLTGLIDWEAIEDRTRYLRKNSHWNNPDEIIKTAARSYKKDLWETQSFYLEVWIE